MPEPTSSDRPAGLSSAWETATSLFHRPSTSLPSRITFVVFSATILTSLVVTWISIHSIQAFLSREIDEKFPQILATTREQLNLWYSQRRLDIETFARSETVLDNFDGLRSRSQRARAREEMRKYLGYVLERFDQYESLVIFDKGGNQLLTVGESVELPTDVRARLASVARPEVSGVFPFQGEVVQIASAPIQIPSRGTVGSLHALVRLESIQWILHSDDLGPTGEIFLIGSDGTYLLKRGELEAGTASGLELPAEGTEPRVATYRNEAGTRAVGTSLLFEPFGWAIVVEEPYDEAFEPVIAVIWRVLGINLAIVLLFGLIAFQIATSIVRPIKALSGGARRIAEGETDVVITEASSQDELGLLTRTFNKMTARLHRNQLELQQNRLEIEAANSRLRAQNEELQRANESLEMLSVTDDLTKLYNHRCFQDQLTREIKRVSRTRAPLTLILIDIDNFKDLNDTHGHAAGDAVLKQIGPVITEVTRDTDFVARYGGEEFAVLATQTDLDGVMALAEKIRTAVSEKQFEIEGESGPQSLSIRVSLGVSRYRGDRRAFFNDADRALYQAKAAGKDCVSAAEPTA